MASANRSNTVQMAATVLLANHLGTFGSTVSWVRSGPLEGPQAPRLALAWIECVAATDINVWHCADAFRSMPP